MPGAPTAARLGAALVLAGLGFGSPSLLVAGLGLVGLAAVAVAWVELAPPRRLVRAPGPGAGGRGRALPAADRAPSAGRLPPPGGELTDPVLDEPLAIGPRWRRRHRRGGARCTAAAGAGSRRRGWRSATRSACASRAVDSDEPGELLVLPRIEPVVAVGGRGRRRAPALLAGSRTGPRRARSTPARSSSRSTGCAPTARAARRRGSTGRRSPAPGELFERHLVAGADAAPLVVLDADPARRAPRRSTPPSAPRPRSAATSPQAGGARCCCPATAARPRSSRTCAAGRRCTPGWRWSSPSRTAPALCRRCASRAVFWVTARANPALPAALRAGSGARYLVGPSAADAGCRRSWSRAVRGGRPVPAAPRGRWGRRRERRRRPGGGGPGRRRAGRAPSRPQSASAPAPVAIELALFAASGGLRAWRSGRGWSSRPPPALMLALAVVCVAATGLGALAGLRPGIRRTLLALAVAAAGLCVGALVARRPARAPARARPLGRASRRDPHGIGGIEEAQLPYGGADDVDPPHASCSVPRAGRARRGGRLLARRRRGAPSRWSRSRSC